MYAIYCPQIHARNNTAYHQWSLYVSGPVDTGHAVRATHPLPAATMDGKAFRVSHLPVKEWSRLRTSNESGCTVRQS